jgi:hypothetical protein
MPKSSPACSRPKESHASVRSAVAQGSGYESGKPKMTRALINLHAFDFLCILTDTEL